MTETLATAKWPQISAGCVMVVPLGSTEQHGPHLPFNTDAVVAGAVARGLAARVGLIGGFPEMIIAPTIAYGASGEHQAFAGTASVGHDALHYLLIELVRSFSTFASRIVFVNGHGGNVSALSTALPRMIAENHNAAWIPCAAGSVDAHAGRTETSLMLHLAPETVEIASASPGNTAPMAELLPLMREKGVRGVSPTGVLGDPTGSSAAEGERVLEAMIASAVERFTSGAVDARGCLMDSRS